MKNHALLFATIVVLAAPFAAVSHDAGTAHDDARSSAQLPPEMIGMFRSGKGIPAAGSDVVKSLADRYLTRRSNRTEGVKRTAVSVAQGAPQWQYVTTPFNPLDAFSSAAFTPVTYVPPTGNGLLMAASFAPFKPKVRYNWDGTTFFVEGDNMPAGMANRMAGITSWQQQIPLPVSYFAGTVNPENSAASLGYQQPNCWRLPLTPTVAATPTLIFTPGSTTNNFQRGAIALASNGVAIFNPANNTGRVSYEIGELDYYGGHCGLADDYHYHIIPTHLSSRFGGPLTDDKPLAWALDGYAIYGFVEPDGTARQALDSNGGHDIGNGWSYHYHAIGNNTVDATHPYGTPQSPYTMTSFKGTVVNFGGQVDGQPEVGSIRQDGSGGYNAKPIAGAYISAMMNPAPLVADGSGNLSLPAGVNLTGCSTTFGSATVNCASTTGLATGMAIVGLGVNNNATVTQINSATQFTLSAVAIATTAAQNFTAVSLAGASADQFVMRVNMGGTDYDECWKINRSVNPRTLTVTWRAQALIGGALSGPVVTTTNTYTPAAGTASGDRITPYAMSGPSQTAIPDTSETQVVSGAPFGEDSDYTINPQSLTDNGNGTITDNVTGLMWQKTDNGESTWETAVANAASVNAGGYNDWRLPTPSELFSIFNHNNNPALDLTKFPSNPNGAADYWWTSDVYVASTTNVWCSNSGGGLGPKPKTETISAGGTFRYNARYVRSAKPTNTHNYQNNGDGTITDLDTGLMWTQLPAAPMNWNAAISYAENLSLGGYNDWRLPNVKELQTLTDYSLTTATSTTGIKPSINRTMFAKTLTNCTTIAGGTTITCADTTGLIPGMVLVDPSDAGGAYIPSGLPAGTGTPSPVIQAVANGTTFTVTSGTGIVAGSGLTFKALAPPTAYWSSSVVRAGTLTQAWLVETGINSSVPAGSGPTRNSQGIISYEIFASTYPVFAVRTTSVTTQIAVAQGANTLTDGVSTIGYSAAGSKTFTITNTGVTSLTLSGITIDGANAANFPITGAPANPTTLAANASVSFSVQFSAANAGSYSAALHIANNDPAMSGSFDVNLTGNVAEIGQVVISPAAPAQGDAPYVSAKITPPVGKTAASSQLTYTVGSGSTATAAVFNETMSSTPTPGGSGGWDGTGAVYPWSLVFANGAGNIKQTTAANHTATGQGGTCGIEFSKGSTTTANSATTTNPINATGTSGTVSFWIATSNLASGQGWTFQLSTDNGGTWAAATTGQLTELTGSNHAFQQYTYTLQASERVSTLKIRFNFFGNGNGTTPSKVQIDDITVVMTTTVTPPTFTATMYDDGTHGDAVAGDGIFTGQITQAAAQAAGAQVGISITANYSDSTSTMLANAGSYTVTAPVSITMGTTLQGALTSAAYTQSLAANGGTGPYSWSVTGGALPTGVTLGTNGTFSGTATTAGTYSFAATVTDSAGHTASLAFSLTVKVPPNILIILTDDQGWGDIGYHTYPGRVHVDTPNMDSFGTSGIRMERFYPTAVCSVTRACLLTGRNTIRTGVNNSRGLDLSEHIMPQTFGAAGYQTFITGKWHVGGPENNICYKTVNGQTVRVIQEGDAYRPYNRGWQMHYGEYGVIDAMTHYESSLLNPITQPTWLRPDWWLNGTQYFDGDPTQNTDAEGHGGYATDLLADKAASIITNANGDRDPTKPLLLYLPFSQVHGPVSAPAAYLAKYGNASDSTHYIADVPTRTIAASVDCMDVAIGRVLSALDSMNMANNTLVIFMSDNGGENATGGSDLPLRGAKTEPYDGGIRTPCGIRFPGKLAGGLQLTNCTVSISGNTATATCDSTAGLYAGMALTSLPGSALLNWGTRVASVTDATHFVLTSTNPSPQQAIASPITLTAGVVSNQFLWVGDIFPTICAAAGVTPQNTKPFDGLNMWPAWQSISGANPDGTQTRFQTNPDGSKNTTTTNISPLVTLASPNVAFNTYTDPISGQTKVFKDIYSQSTSAVILTHCATVANNTTVMCDSTAGLTAGGAIYGSGIKGNATVISITDATHFVMSDPPNVAYASITLNVGFPTNQLFNIQDDPYETTDYLLAVNQTALGLTPTQITQFNAIAAAMQTSISINPTVYPPYVGPTLITNSAVQGSTIQLYVPFTSYAKNAPTIQWRKNGVNLTDGTTASGSSISGSTTFTQNTTAPDAGYGNPSVPTNGAYNSVLTITNVTTGDAGSYDLVISNVDTYQVPNVTNTVTSPAGTLSVVVGAPVLAAEPAYTIGASNTVSWSAITNATGYTVQAATDVNFTNIVGTQTGSTTSTTFTGLTSGTQYWFRATATDGVTTSVFSNVVTSTQDAGNPTVAITSPANGTATTATSITVTGTAGDAISGVASVTVNGVAATTADNYAHWSATVPLAIGVNPIIATALDNAQSGGNSGIASINVTLTPNAPVISNVTTGPTSPTYLDNTWITALVQAAPGAPISTVSLTYDASVPVTTVKFRESFANTSSNNWNGSGGLYPWTTVGAGNVRQSVSTSNNTVPISLAGSATSTTAGVTTATCTSTAKLWPGMLVSGPGIPGSINGTQTGNTTIATISDATHFTLSQPVPADTASVALTVAGVTLTNCTTTNASVNVTCDSTAGLVNGMALTGTGLANNATVATVTGATTFTMNVAPTTASSPGVITITASGAAAEFNGGTPSITGSTFTTTNTIDTHATDSSGNTNASANSGYVEFTVQTRDLAATNNNGWALQVSDNTGTYHTPTSLRVSTDGGVTFNTLASDTSNSAEPRSESWNGSTINLTNVVTNSTGNVAGNTTVTCASTTGLAAGRAVAGPNAAATGVVTNGSASVTGVTNTASLAVGMFVQGTGIANNTRILTLDTVNNTFTMSANAGTAATGTTTNLVANHFPTNATVSAISNDGVTFTLNTAAYVNTSAAPITATATTVNHGFQLYHYDLAPSELNTNVRLRFQFAGYTATAPLRSPRVDVDDIVVATTTQAPPNVITMYDDGLHGDGVAGDHIYGAQIPVQVAGANVSYFVRATDNNSQTTSTNGASYTVGSSLTDSTISQSEFLSIPSDQGVTLNILATSDQDAYVEYGTSPGSLTGATPITTFPHANGPMQITLTGLQPDTEYYYRLRLRNTGTTTFNARGIRSFHTARQRGSSFVFTISADPHLDVNTDASLLSQTIGNIAQDGPDFHIDLGDIFLTDKLADLIQGVPSIYGGIPGGTLSQMIVLVRALIFRSYFEQTCHSVPYFFTLGNHEAEYGYTFNADLAASPPTHLNDIPYWDLVARKNYYPAPVPDSFYTGNGTTKDYPATSGIPAGTLGLLEDYYAWEWGDALFIVLDPYWNTVSNPNQTNNAWNWSLGKAQYDWLTATLQNSSARFKFVFMHHLVGGTWTLADGVTPNCAARGGVEVAPYFEWGGKNVDGTDGFAANRPGWAMPIHNLLVANKVNAVFHGHDHLYDYQTLDGIVYQECPQPGTANYTQFGSGPDGKYSASTPGSVMLPNSGHLRVTVSPAQTKVEYVRAYRTQDISASQHNRDISHSYTMAPRTYPPVEIVAKTAGSATFRWNAVPNKPYSVQWSPDLVNWTTIDNVTFGAANTNGSYTDTNGTRVNAPKGFYRVSFTP